MSRSGRRILSLYSYIKHIKLVACRQKKHIYCYEKYNTKEKLYKTLVLGGTLKLMVIVWVSNAMVVTLYMLVSFFDSFNS
ncbi:hypothetical protein T190423A01A_60153 [Tenacibaculum sp. 190130A14a]|uniref:Uncharacterized protein n=1 Tax=Tenacibaculum polynesiense TaxID=3137857 RepID=A0ABM9PFH7_9FLAO